MGMGAQQGGQTTTTNAPYSGFQPYIGTALGQAGNLLQSGGPKYYPGQQVASFNPIQNQAFSNTNSLDNSLAQGSGNPFETAMFNQAANATQNQLASEFAGSGRDITGSLPLRAQQLNQLGTDFYGQNYQNSVNNAFNATNQQQQLGAQIQNQSQNLINASKAAYDYNQQQPYKNLSQYESFISGLMPGTGQQSSPYFTNPGANLLGTALAGQQLYNGMGNKPSGGGGGMSNLYGSTPSLGGFIG